MHKKAKEQPVSLTNEERIKIYTAIGARMTADDMPPSLVIANQYDGDEERYLRAMAKWHNVPIDS